MSSLVDLTPPFWTDFNELGAEQSSIETSQKEWLVRHCRQFFFLYLFCSASLGENPTYLLVCGIDILVYTFAYARLGC